MNWLEVGCPHCPNVVTFPLSAAGRTVCCLECEKTYLVPTPSANGASRPPASAEPPSACAVEASAAALEPTVAMTDVAAAGAPDPPPQSAKEPPSPLSPKGAEAVEPQLAVDSPLLELPILDPPREAVGSKPTPNIKPPAREATATIAAPPPPLGQQAAGPRETTEEAQVRMHRAEMRAKVNLMIFVVGTTVMIAFSYLVIYFSRRR